MFLGGDDRGIPSPGENNIPLKKVTHLCSGWPRPLRIGRSVEMAWCGRMLQAASVTAPTRLLLLFWRPPRPHPPNRSAACPFSSGVNVWLQREDTLAPVDKRMELNISFVGVVLHAVCHNEIALIISFPCRIQPTQYVLRTSLSPESCPRTRKGPRMSRVGVETINSLTTHLQFLLSTKA